MIESDDKLSYLLDDTKKAVEFFFEEEFKNMKF